MDQVSYQEEVKMARITRPNFKQMKKLKRSVSLSKIPKSDGAPNSTAPERNNLFKGLFRTVYSPRASTSGDKKEIEDLESTKFDEEWKNIFQVWVSWDKTKPGDPNGHLSIILRKRN